MNSILIACILLILSNQVIAQTDEGYINAVGDNLQIWHGSNDFYGSITAAVITIKDGVVLYKSSGNHDYDREAVRAANAAWDVSIVPGLLFDVKYSGKSIDSERFQQRLKNQYLETQ
jgi:hypothetical protein